jgi:hypothetical protein
MINTWGTEDEIKHKIIIRIETRNDPKKDTSKLVEICNILIEIIVT